jgi:hypothetical protein
MILPTKHINFSQSLLGLGSYVLSQLQSPKSIDELWEKYKADYENKIYLARHSFENLFLISIVKVNCQLGSFFCNDSVILFFVPAPKQKSTKATNNDFPTPLYVLVLSN